MFGGIALIAAGMLFGDIFAVFVLHQNGGQTGQALLAATQAVAAQNPSAVKAALRALAICSKTAVPRWIRMST